jgi:uncharacterized protein YqgC (DUF456 family)
METVNNTQHEFELEDLRQQMAAIKEKVDQQGHLNEELVKEAIQSKMKGVHRTLFKISLVALLCIPCYIAMRYTYNFSWPFIIVTILMLIGFVLADYLINRLDVSHMGDDLVETARKLAQMKKNRSLSQKIGIAVTIPWLAWFCYESFMHRAITYGTADTWGYVITCFVGGIIGFLIGMRIFRKMQRANDEMIDQINELMSEP